MKELSSTTPYLLRAVWEWCGDNGLTPYIAVKVDAGTKVPLEYVRNGEIVLNISSDATRNLKIGKDLIQFSARFNGVSREVSVPMGAVSVIFAKETGQSLAFHGVGGEVSVALTPPVRSVASSENSKGGDGDKPTTPPGGRPHLQVVK